MLLKLMKHEFKNNAMTFLALYAGLLMVGILLRFSSAGDFANFLVFAFTIFSFTTIIFSFVTIILSYNRSMFKKEGYLTLTLPVSTSALLFSKIFVAAIWFILSFMVIVLASFITIPDMGEVWTEFVRMSDLIGLSQTFTLLALTGIFSVLELVFTLYLIVTLVHTSAIKKFRAFSGIAMYFAINYLVGFIKQAFLSSNASTLEQDPSITSFLDLRYFIDNINSFLSATMWINIVLSLFISTLAFLGIRYLLANKVELD